ncbi:MAG: choice-of-anchor J domain-containing protein, partial [Muribaculaceae bacterium]|nr:choice-of-anchor J domain-containing protein [Muribaculaceae bacterium]
GLSGVRTEAGNVLTWKAIDMTKSRPAPVLETFESCDPFADTAPGWTFLDRDGKGIGYMIESSKGYQIPNHPSLQPAGFFIWDHATSRFSGPCNAYSGTKFLASVFNNDYSAVNDWAISPLLSGDEQTISFYAQSYDDNGGGHPEQLQIYYATEDTNDPDKFVKLTTFGNNGTYNVPCVRVNGMSAYTAVQAVLPAGAKRFAFVSTAADAWMLMIDDVCFTPDASINSLKFVGYNIYRDGVKLNTELLTEPRYVDPDNNAEHEYRVTAVFEQGESELSSPLVISTSGISQVTPEAYVSVTVDGCTLTVSGAGELPVVVVTPDGRVACSAVGDVRVDLSANIYIVKVGTMVKKVVVR